jgi:hypothetical protein
MKNIRRLIEKTKGKIFSVTFIKKNGKKRTINGRLDVEKFVTGKGLAFDPKKKGLIVVFDLQKNDYRMLNLKAITHFRCGAITFKRSI